MLVNVASLFGEESGSLMELAQGEQGVVRTGNSLGALQSGCTNYACALSSPLAPPLPYIAGSARAPCDLTSKGSAVE